MSNKHFLITDLFSYLQSRRMRWAQTKPRSLGPDLVTDSELTSSVVCSSLIAASSPRRLHWSVSSLTRCQTSARLSEWLSSSVSEDCLIWEQGSGDGKDTNNQLGEGELIVNYSEMASRGSMTKIYTYARTMKSKSDYANNMKRLSAQIFGEVRL